MSEDLVPVARALLSVSDKTGLVDLATALSRRGIELISTGGTARALRDAGLAVRDVAAVTGFPEMLDGRVKTLHPMVHAGLLAIRDRPAHLSALRDHGIGAIDLVVVNLYPFEAAAAAGGADFAACVETIDVGGPAMLRAAAKNHRFVTVVTDVEDYAPLLAELDANAGATGLAFRRCCALTAFGRTAAYDAAVSAWLAEASAEPAPRRRILAGRLAQPLRYGENPHQRAAFYRDAGARPGVATAFVLQGKALSYNNINDTDAAFELVAEFAPGDAAACAIVKHANPCGVACGVALVDAYRAARDCDPASAFGGVVALNRTLDAETAAAIAEIFTEVVIAPDATEEAAEVFARKPSLRLLVTGGLPDPGAPDRIWRQVAGGFLVQDRDTGQVRRADLRVVTRRAPTAEEIDDLLFAWTVVKHVKSNAIVTARDRATLGIGAGQMSRVDAVRIAGRKARDIAGAPGPPDSAAAGSVAASDAFFPFPDGLIGVAEAGVVAVIQPGGSVRDDEVIAAADAAGIAMVFTGMRHFRH